MLKHQPELFLPAYGYPLLFSMMAYELFLFHRYGRNHPCSSAANRAVPHFLELACRPREYAGNME